MAVKVDGAKLKVRDVARVARPDGKGRFEFDPDFELGAKDASALINGSTTSLALGALATFDARRLLKHADIAATCSPGGAGSTPAMPPCNAPCRRS